VRFRELIIDAAIFQQRVESLQRHFRAIFGKPNLVKNADGGKSAEVALLLEFLTLPER
jgi:hypothetical protein